MENLRTTESGTGVSDAPAPRAPSWLVGRDRLFDEAIGALLDGQSVLLTGPPGVGTSALARALADAVATRGLSVRVHHDASRPDRRRVVGSADSDSGPDEGRTDVLLLDADSSRIRPADLDAVVDGSVLLIAALSEDPLLAAERIDSELLALWRNGRARRIDVPPLDDRASDALIDLVAAGRGVGALQRTVITRGAAGLPRLVLELADEVLAGASTNDWDLRPPPPRLTDLVLPRLRRIKGPARAAFRTALLLDGAPTVRMRRVLGDRWFRELTLIGVLWSDPVADTCHVPAAYRRVAEWVEPVETAERTALARTLVGDEVLRLRFVPQELEVLASAQMADASVLADLADDAVARIFAGGSLRAALTGHPDRAFDYAVAAARHDDAWSWLVEACRTAITRRGPAPGWRRYDAALRALDWPRARGLAESLPADAAAVEHLDALGVLAVVAALEGGDPALESRLEAIRAFCAVPAVFASEATRSAGHLPTAATAAAFVRAITGTTTPAFAADIDALTRWSVGQGHRLHYPQLAAAAGIAVHMRGDFVRSEIDFAFALRHGLPDAAPLSRSWVHALRALALNESGRASEAGAALAAAQAERVAPFEWDDLIILLAGGILAAGTADGERALAEVLARGLEVGGRSPMLGLLFAHQAVRLGAGDGSTADAVDSLAAAAGLPIGMTMASTVRAILEGSRPRPSGAVGFDEEHALFAQDTAAGRGPDTGAPISAREREVAELAAEGLGNAAIAARLFLSARTVESHLYNLRRKLGAVSRLDYARLIAERGRRTR